MDDEAPGVPEWVVTYGDMMSLLLTFFIMLVSLSEVVADKKYQAILEAIMQYSGYEAAPPSPEGKNFALNSVVERLDTLGSFTSGPGTGGIRQASMPGESLQILRTREGKPRRVGNPILFETGEFTLSEAALDQLVEAARQLAGKPNKIDLRGHVAHDTENTGIMLCYQRSKAVRAELIALGISPVRIRITAVGSAEPETTISDQLTPHPDRVEVMILDAFASEFIGPSELPE
ncbi:OmpA/MotB family protein [Thalassoroseus pseudoceratinae]|uniref:OmpA/MotB family protein n=1 Tax=Thalassoroseus pseudoceratinae TaxID=2713176 RepID=UPI00141E7681|nr:flagellar motor protein MotB [Thalassoroseus pseudoceratinae]